MAKETKVTRITASDEPRTVKSGAKTAKVVKAKKQPVTKKGSALKAEATETEGSKNIFVRIGNYFKGAWVELKQVRWPTRKATWSLTLAVILFSAFFVVLILLLDSLFKYLFELIIT